MGIHVLHLICKRHCTLSTLILQTQRRKLDQSQNTVPTPRYNTCTTTHSDHHTRHSAKCKDTKAQIPMLIPITIPKLHITSHHTFRSSPFPPHPFQSNIVLTLCSSFYLNFL